MPILFVPTALSDQQNHGARPPAEAIDLVVLSPQADRTLPLASAIVTTPPASATSWAIAAAQKPSSAKTTSWSRECVTWETAFGTSDRNGFTRYWSRDRFQEIATSGRTP
ncbi:hypothetical protein [Arthrobacter cheniae]|uniref:hypothetical protein n=1 Tax=Arthrobacter cheniae TaxID=1258888 RepID=UPI001C7CECE4|nr:hypothetical protein [Arthrobacter cheniae]